MPGGRAETLTLAEWVEEYLGAHQGERVTIAKLRWLLGKATVALGEVPLTELSPDQVSAWRLTVPEGHVTMIDLHYGHLAVDSHEHAVSLLDALALERAVDAGWTSARRSAKLHRDTVSRPRGRRSWRAVDARWTPRPEPVASSPGRRS